MRPFLVLLSALLLASCGFAPRGALVMPDGLGPVRVTGSDPYSPLVTGVSRALQRQGVALADGDRAGTAVLTLGNESFRQGPLMAENFSSIQEYVTTYTATVQLRDARGNEVIPLQTVTLEREYVYDTRSPIGTPAEQELIQEELRRDMVAAILRRVDAALR
ncbi:LPS assembly lipoprotein LptE [Coralloluteibacterium thermophilus]|uniref:LPS-assembly lipoprotein LptE n=1 Tax=Coralloluteibacterium thermophilum TaxID=2707049 RepID=A0ABV9NNQ2_9GAMM